MKSRTDSEGTQVPRRRNRRRPACPPHRMPRTTLHDRGTTAERRSAPRQRSMKCPRSSEPPKSSADDERNYRQRHHPRGVDGIVRHHAVVNVHGEQRHDQREDIDQQVLPLRHRDRPAIVWQGVPRTSDRSLTLPASGARASKVKRADGRRWRCQGRRCLQFVAPQPDFSLSPFRERAAAPRRHLPHPPSQAGRRLRLR